MATYNVSSKDFYRRTRATNAQMRQAEALGVIRPLRAGTGFRIFAEEDVVAMNAWDGNRRRPKQRAPKKRPQPEGPAAEQL